MTFEPRIVGFLCNWCSYAGADLAGVSRISYPTNIRIIRLMCSGRVEPVIVLETLAQGADGVLVMGCHIGDCHYISGNLYAERKINVLKKLLARTSLEVGRLRLEWVSASEGGRFAELVKDFVEQIKALGPSPLAGDKPDKNILAGVLAAKAAAEDFRLRLLVGREKTMIDDGNVYGEKVSEEELDKILNEVIDTEFVRNRIYLLVKEKPLSVKELSERLDLDSKTVLRHVVVMRRRGLITVDRVEGTSPLYTALEVGR
ncbi:MAG: F420-non-reducing hydrogenase iron-sulfur subunit D [Candidatus Bathyarchaeota archaeon BA2]|nr:MAG: F420-non-reducing hydrogenase iron-sulfur subunit D [Candidatus Bathyarchaeota archaeon BA2]